MTATLRPARPRAEHVAGFARLVHAEWTKFRSVPGWVAGMVAAVAVTVLVSLLAASGSGSDANEASELVTGPDGDLVSDAFHFVHGPMTGDGSVTVQVTDQDASHDGAMAGLMIKDGTTPGSAYAAVMVTPAHGVRLRADYDTDIAGGDGGAPRWLRLDRSGAEVTAYESADGAEWTEIGTVRVRGLLETAEVGAFVASPPEMRVERQAGSTSVGETATIGHATFEELAVDAGDAADPERWTGDDIGQAMEGGVTRAGGTLTVTGSGDIGPDPPDDDPVQIGLFGAVVGLMVVVAVAVLCATSEYRRSLIRTTFAVTPRRGQVLAAKAVVIGSVTFVAGLVAAVAAFLLTRPLLRDAGFAPPAFPEPSLLDGPVLRAVVGTAAMLAIIAVFALAAGIVTRHSAGAITGVVMLVVLPILVASALPPGTAEWIMRLTPAGALAIQRTKEPTAGLVEPWAMVGPWAGFGVLCLYATVAVVLAARSLRGRDA
ncbi:ABC transporter permease subunit [Jiangella anatolica]|uniref:ABC transporter permease n=1 Tax=Jiangella anatolica TaxID=2670374 RepID=A0A2W2BA93_9ACTN|nr:ABC transporter permease subunit [Jiangella anatolica]PZF82130.1 ABC transporter permease [Jiangella anatolica]